MNNLIDILILDDSHHILKVLLNRKIEIYGIDYSSIGTIYRIKASDIDKIPFEIKIISHKGIKRFLYAFIEHKYFLLGLFISIIEMFILSNIVVKIDVLHNDKEIRSTIYQALEDNDIHKFMFKKSFNEIQKIKEKIKEKNKDMIEWIEIIDEGMKYNIRVEKREKISLNNEKKYCDVKSTKDAIITNSLVYKGQSLIDVNDFVKKDSTLVSGEIIFNEDIKAYTCADAIVYGNTWYTVNIKVPYNALVKKYTGKKKNNYMITVMNKGKPILKNHFKKYDSSKKLVFKIGPIKLYKLKEREYKIIEKKYTKSTLIKEALKKARKEIKKQVGSYGSIIDEKVLQTEDYDSIIIMDIFYSIKEPIGKIIEKEIPIERVKESAAT